MAVTVTEETEGNSSQPFGTGGNTTASFTPEANSTLLVGIACTSNNNGPVSGVALTNTGGLNFEQVAGPQNLQENATTVNVAVMWFSAEVGGSPSSMTITMQGSKSNLATLDVYSWNWWVASVTGTNGALSIGTVQRSASRTDPGALAFNLLSTPDTNGGVFAMVSSIWNADATGTMVTAGSGWTEAFQYNNSDINTQVQYDITSPDISVEWVDISAGTGTFLGYSACAIEVIDAAETTPSTHHAKVASWARTVTAGNAALSCTLPAGIETGDLILGLAATDNLDASASGYTEMFDTANGTAVRGFVLGRIATGSDALTIDNAGAQDIAVIVLCIKDHGVTDLGAVTQGTPATGTSTTPAPPNVNPGVADEWLYLNFFFADDDDNAGGWVFNTVGVAEQDTGTQAESAASTSSVMLGYSHIHSVATSFDGTGFVLAASEEWIAGSMAIPPEVVGGGEPEPPPHQDGLTRRVPGWVR